MKILLTNDDSHDSPLFKLAIEHLEPFGELRIVVPAEEQSWKGKSMTRYGAVTAAAVKLHGRDAFSVTGTPADCASLGMHNLYDDPPDVVVSGINIGINTGLGFMFASGTVGACLEANVSRLPAIALSQHLSLDTFRTWDSERRFDSDVVDKLAAGIEAAMPAVWRAIEPQRHTHAGRALTWNVNFPIEASAAPITWSRLGETYYKRVFTEQGGHYRHRLGEFVSDPDPLSDEQVVRNGNTSITAVDIRQLMRQPEEV